jgi:hypothetical protein
VFPTKFSAGLNGLPSLSISDQPEYGPGFSTEVHGDRFLCVACVQSNNHLGRTKATVESVAFVWKPILLFRRGHVPFTPGHPLYDEVAQLTCACARNYSIETTGEIRSDPRVFDRLIRLIENNAPNNASTF